jgi:hypothetical protein
VVNAYKGMPFSYNTDGPEHSMLNAVSQDKNGHIPYDSIYVKYSQ